MRVKIILVCVILTLSLACDDGGGRSCITQEEFFMSDCQGEDQLDLCEQLFCGFTVTTVDPPIAVDFFLGGRGTGQCEPVDCNGCMVGSSLIDFSSGIVTTQDGTFLLFCS